MAVDSRQFYTILKKQLEKKEVVTLDWQIGGIAATVMTRMPLALCSTSSLLTLHFE